MQLKSPTILFDGSCVLCRNLAHLVAARSGGRLEAEAWQDVSGDAEATALRVFDGTNMHEGQAAWRYLIAGDLDVTGLGWLAKRLGLAEGAADALEFVGRAARRLCFTCPKR